MRRRSFVLMAIAFALLLTVVTCAAVLFSSQPPELGPVAGRLRPCPDSPNCVCSFDSDPEHGIAALATADVPHDTLQQLRSLLDTLPRVRIVAEEGPYLRAEFTTKLLRFVDDVEFLLDERSRLIHVRSASRVGHSDLGANRQRIEWIRSQLAGRAS